MADVFISYARSTAAQAQQVAEALGALGYGVWRDDELPAHRAYADVIEERLQAAKAVVVMWSAEAVKSEWVRSEADRARADHKLVQLTVETCRLPMPFDQIQCADLTGWTGGAETPGWRKVVASIAELLGASSAVARSSPAASPAPPKVAEPLLAVLAFDNLSGDPEMVYFSDGVSEEIQQTVARGVDLRVIGRASSFQFRGADKAAAHVGGELAASHVLDGSVRSSGARVRISAQLIECATATTLWSDRFDGDLTDAFALQDKVAAAVALALKKTFAPPALARPINAKAHDLYLRAKALFIGMREQDRAERLGMAMDLLEDAVALAPDFASAWADLAYLRAESFRNAKGHFPKLSATKVRAAADNALALDPGAGVAYVALGLLEPFGRYQAREALYGKALAAAPSDPDVISSYAHLLLVVGRHREALTPAEKACDLDPLNDGAALVRAMSLTLVGRQDDARRALEDGLVRWPEVPRFVNDAIVEAFDNQAWERFDALVVRAGERGFDSPRLRGLISYYQHLRDPGPDYVDRMLDAVRRELARTGTVRVNQLLGLHSLGAEEEAFELIDQASFAHMFDPDGPPPTPGYTPAIIWLPLYTAIRRDPRFVDFCAKLGLVDYWVASGQWPDCVDAGVLPYDFMAECRRIAGAVV